MDDKEMKELTDAVGKTVQEQIEGVQKSLKEELMKGTSPINDKVIDLEKKLTELLAQQKESQEAIRLIQAGVTHKGKAGDGKVDVGEIFKGAFFTNHEELRQRIRMMGVTGDETRAISSSLFSTGGKLNPEQADVFIDYIIAMQVGLSRCVTRRMNSPQGNTDEIRVANRKLRKATEATAPGLADAVTTKRRTMTTVENIWAEDITLTFLEDNVERRDAEAHIARLLANNFGNDLNDLAWNGDEDIDSAGAQPFLTINDGWITLMIADSDVNDVDLTDTVYGPADSTTTAAKVLHYTWQAMPIQFKGRTDHLYWVPVPFAEAYAEEVSRRISAFGDAVLVNGFPNLRYFGTQIVPEPHLLGNQADRIVLTPAANLFHGIQRNITVDSMWQPRKRVVEYTITARNDYEYGTGQAIVLTDGLPAHLK